MGEIEIAFARVAEAIRARGAVPEDVIVGLETLRGTVGRWLSGTGGAIVAPRHGRYIVAPSGAQISLARRPTLRRLVLALVRAHALRLGEALAAPELVRAGWPHDATVGPETAANRLRVALCRLRQLGLGAVILTTSSGWLLDPNVSLVQDGDADTTNEADKIELPPRPSGVFTQPTGPETVGAAEDAA